VRPWQVRSCKSHHERYCAAFQCVTAPAGSRFETITEERHSHVTGRRSARVSYSEPGVLSAINNATTLGSRAPGVNNDELRSSQPKPSRRPANGDDFDVKSGPVAALALSTSIARLTWARSKARATLSSHIPGLTEFGQFRSQPRAAQLYTHSGMPFYIHMLSSRPSSLAT
jgi:hypothetical protein